MSDLHLALFLFVFSIPTIAAAGAGSSGGGNVVLDRDTGEAKLTSPSPNALNIDCKNISTKASGSRDSVNLRSDPRTAEAFSNARATLEKIGSKTATSTFDKFSALPVEEIPEGYSTLYSNLIFDPQCRDGKVVLAFNATLFHQLKASDKALAINHSFFLIAALNHNSGKSQTETQMETRRAIRLMAGDASNQEKSEFLERWLPPLGSTQQVSKQRHPAESQDENPTTGPSQHDDPGEA